jgi:hypothetical protein
LHAQSAHHWSKGNAERPPELEIEITPAMIAAGFSEFLEFDSR